VFAILSERVPSRASPLEIVLSGGYGAETKFDQFSWSICICCSSSRRRKSRPPKVLSNFERFEVREVGVFRAAIATRTAKGSVSHNQIVVLRELILCWSSLINSLAGKVVCWLGMPVH
jgi:hypothetical protein